MPAGFHDAACAWLSANGWFLVEAFIKASIIGAAIQAITGFIVLAERWTASWIQDRVGPNRCGPRGLFQPISDALKLLFKEDILPDHVNKPFYILAPVMSLMPALSTLAVVPFGPDVVLESGRVIKLQVADLNIGVIFIFALASLGVYGLALGGWASNSKYSLLGAIRSAAQMISYELALGLSALTVIIATGTLRLNGIIDAQGGAPWDWHMFGFGGALLSGDFSIWRLVSVVPMGIACVIFVISAFAETNRMPFDMPEAESELVSGYHTEFSAMKFGLFFLAEYANMLTACALATALFFGGWHFPFYETVQQGMHPIAFGLLGMVVFFTKLGGCMFFMMVVRWTVPRFRYDQLMGIGWKRLLPASLICVVATAALSLAMGPVVGN